MSELPFQLLAGRGASKLVKAGCLDAGFGVDGRVTVPSGMRVNGIAIQTVAGEKRIVVVGETYATQRTPKSWIVVRYLPDGSLDPSFGSGGIVKMTPKSGFYSAGAVAVDSSNRLVALYSTGLARFDVAGAFDPTFGDSGIANLRQEGYWFEAGFAIQPDQKILVTGAFENYLAIKRLDANGTADPDFGTDSLVTTLFGVNYLLGHIAVQSDHKFVVAGTSDKNPALARYWYESPEPPQRDYGRRQKFGDMTQFSGIGIVSPEFRLVPVTNFRISV